MRRVLAEDAPVSDAPYAADTRAKGWRFELDHERIRQSDTWALAPADVRPWLLMLWMVAWEQTPCGSMPAETGLIAARIGMAPRAFEKHRAVLLRGWKQADDGRLYHPVVTERVLEMVAYREKTATRKAEYRDRMRESRESPKGVPSDSMAAVPQDSTVRNDTGTGTGTGTGTKEKEKEKGARKRSPGFDAAQAELPEWLDAEVWQRWCADRRARGKPITEEGAKGQIKRLDEYRRTGTSPTRVLEHAIASGNQGLYPPPEVKGNGHSYRERDIAAKAARYAEMSGNLVGKAADNPDIIDMETTNAARIAHG